MKRGYLIAIIMVCCVLAITFVACDKGADVDEHALSDRELTLNVNDEKRIDLMSEGMIIVDNIAWTSADDKIATVRDGLISARSEGETTIKATYEDREYACLVKVVAKELVLSDSRLALEIGNTHELVLKENGVKIEKGVTWKSSDEEVISIDNGYIVAKKAGESIVTARYGDRSFICNIIVREPFDGVGKYYSKMYVKEMDVTFEFDLVINEDGTYVYDRRGNSLIEGMIVNSGTWTYVNRTLILTHADGEMRFSIVDNDSIASIGKITTGGMDVELTFDRVK